MVNENSSVGETFGSAESSWLPMTELKIANKVNMATEKKKVIAENRDTAIIGENSPHVFWASQARNTVSGQHTFPIRFEFANTLKIFYGCEKYSSTKFVYKKYTV